METRSEVIKASRLKGAFYLLICIGFTAAGYFMVTDSAHYTNPVMSWLMLLFFGLGTLVLGWTQIKPQVLLLEPEGFTVTGGLVRRPRKVPWSEIDHFFVYRLPKGGSIVGYNYKEGRRPATRLAKLSSSLGADAGLPKGWPMSPEKMVEKMNRFCGGEAHK